MTADELRKIDREQKEFHASLDHETDRGCCLMAAAYLEYQLENVLKKKLVNKPSIHEKLFDFSGPLGTFSSKIEMSYAIGLIGPKVKQDLILLKKIRNAFAHNHKLLSLADKPMCDIAENFYHNSLTKAKGKFRHNFIQEVVGLFAAIVSKRFSLEHIEEEPDIILDDKLLKALEKMKELKAQGKISLLPPEDEEKKN
jgi:hypothetical protein